MAGACGRWGGGRGRWVGGGRVGSCGGVSWGIWWGGERKRERAYERVVVLRRERRGSGLVRVRGAALLWEEDRANGTVRANRAGFRIFSRTINREDDGVCIQTCCG